MHPSVPVCRLILRPWPAPGKPQRGRLPADLPSASGSSAPASSSSAAHRPPASVSSRSAHVGSGSGSADTATFSGFSVVTSCSVSGFAVQDSGAARGSSRSRSLFRGKSMSPLYPGVGSHLFVPEEGNAAPGLPGSHAASPAIGALLGSVRWMSGRGRGGARGRGGGRGRVHGDSVALSAPPPPIQTPEEAAAKRCAWRGTLLVWCCCTTPTLALSRAWPFQTLISIGPWLPQASHCVRTLPSQ